MLNKTEEKILIIVNEFFTHPPEILTAQKLHAAGITSSQVNQLKKIPDPQRNKITNALMDIERKEKKDHDTKIRTT